MGLFQDGVGLPASHGVDVIGHPLLNCGVGSLHNVLGEVKRVKDIGRDYAVLHTSLYMFIPLSFSH